MLKTKILLAETHEVTRRGLCTLIDKAGRGWSVCAEARTGTEAIEKAAALQPEVITLAIDLAEMNGVHTAPLILHCAPRARLLVVTAYNIEQRVREFIEAGVRGYVLKSDSGRTIVKAIETILHGGTFFSERLRPMIESRNPLPRSGISTRHLTRREREVLTMLSDSRSNEEIGVALGIATKTAETHRTRLMEKLGVHSIAELVRYAIRNELVEA